MVREYPDDAFGPKKMTKKSIRESCRKNKLYLTPHLNDVLYLHYSGFNEIESLEEYVGLKCLWLECNAISMIAGLDNQSELRCLYLHNNLIKKIENLEHCKQLDTLNVSHNHITRVENCGSDVLPVLNTLNISHNYLRSTESVENLRNCDFLSVLDISHNRIEDISVVKVLADMKALRVLTMTGNPVVNDIPSYRKTLILECKNLTYLDQRPVFDKDRACAEAWKRGGYEEERKEHIRWKKEEQRKIRRGINATLRLRHRGDGEPELLKTSSDEEHEGETAEETAINKANELLEITFKSNEDAWQEMETLFREASIENPKPDTSVACALDDPITTLGIEDDGNTIPKQTNMMCALKHILSNSGNDELDDIILKRKPKKLIEEIYPEEVSQSTMALQRSTSATGDGVKKRVSFAIEEASESYTEDEQSTEVLEQTHDDGGDLSIKEFVEEITSEAANLVETLQATVAHNDMEPEDTLNVVIEEKAISIHLDSELKQSPETEEVMSFSPEQMDPATSTSDLAGVDHQERNKTEDNPKIGVSLPDNADRPENAANPIDQNADPIEAGERKYSIVSSENLTGSDSEPTNVTGYERGVRSSSITITSGTDSSDSGDMFDKIVPKKHRKLASIVRSESSTSATESDGEEEGSKKFPSNLERQNTITEFIDEYKRFFRAVDVRDTKCVAKNRNKQLRPQTAKTKRTEPIVYEGVLKSMERNSNQANIAEAKLKMAKETSIFDRLLKGHGAVDMDLEQQTFSIGGKKHDFQEYRLQVFRKDQEKLQNLIDRVTAQKDRYNAHIDSIHDQLSTIMDDYDQISEKLQRVDDMLQNIGDGVTQRKSSSETVVEQIVANLTTPAVESEAAAAVVTAEHEHEHDEPAATDSEVESSHSSSATDDLVLNKIVDNESYTSLVDAFKAPMHSSAQPIASDAPAAEISSADPVYRKFLEIQHEIDQLTDDDVFFLLTEAAGELTGEQEQSQVLNQAVDAYWQKFDDVDQFRQHINLNAHPIIQRFRRFIECQCTEMEPGDGGEVDDRIASWENAYRKYERRLSNQMFDEYKLLSRQASIATTLGGESSATELELLELGDGTVGGIEMEQKVSAWHVDEPSDSGFQQEHETNEDGPAVEGEPVEEEEFEDVESKPIEDGCEESKRSSEPSEVTE